MTAKTMVGPHARLRVLATSDLHCQINAWDYLTDRAAPDRGLTRVATLIERARREVPDCLLLDNGDFIQGSPLGDLAAATPAREGLHPMIAAMNHLRYDAATLGNHEFSHGLPFLDRALQDAGFPIVSANITHLDSGKPFRPPFVILHRRLSCAGVVHDLKIGIVGFAPPQLEQWDHQHIAGRIATRDILLAAADQVPVLRAQGVDLVIALSHSGLGSETAEPGLEDATAALAAQSGIDLLIAGHTHLTFPSTDHLSRGAIDARAGTLHGKPAVMPGFFGSHLGVIDLWLSRDQETWRIARHRSALRAIARRDRTGRMIPRVGRDPQIEAIAAPAHAATLHWARQKVTDSAKVLHSYFALIHPCPTVRVVTKAQTDYVGQRLAGSGWADLPVLSAAAPFRAGGRGGPQNYTMLPPGVIAKRHVADLYIHPNTVTAIEISGAELAEWLERSAGLFQQIVRGMPDQPLINPDFPSFNFDCIDGITYRIDLSAPPRHDVNGRVQNERAGRIVDLMFQDRPVAAEARFVLATNSYRTGGSGGFPGAGPDRVILPGIALTRDVVEADLRKSGFCKSPAPPNWGFVGMPGTSVLFDSSPEALGHVADVPDSRIEALEMTPQGFLRFRLHL